MLQKQGGDRLLLEQCSYAPISVVQRGIGNVTKGAMAT